MIYLIYFLCQPSSSHGKELSKDRTKIVPLKN